MKSLLDFISMPESGGRYDIAYGGAQLPQNLTLDDAINWGKAHGKRTGSSALGRYQFLAPTLSGLKSELGLSGTEAFNPQLQDALATQLLRRRGLDDYQAGKIAPEQFAASLAKEWAGLPAGPSGASYYAGDAMGNRAGVSWDNLLAAVKGGRGGGQDVRIAASTDLPPQMQVTGDPVTGVAGGEIVQDPELLAQIQAALAQQEQIEKPEVVTDPNIINAVRAILGGGEKKEAAPVVPLDYSAPGEQQPSGSGWGGFARGVMDPVNALAQMVQKATPEPVRNAIDSVDAWLGERTGGLFSPLTQDRMDAEEAAYQAQRGDGIDWPRLGGNTLAALALTRGLPVGNSMYGAMGMGAATGAGLGALQPVTGEQLKDGFWPAKADQVGEGALFGGIAGPVARGIGQIVSPNASRDAGLAALRAEGVTPSIGQALGGGLNQLEQKATSTPIMGGMIREAREAGRDTFNRAAINRTSHRVGAVVDDIGVSGVDQAATAVSRAYDRALRLMRGFVLDPRAQAQISSLETMARGMPRDQHRQFTRYINDYFRARLSPAGGMEAGTFKRIESELGERAARYGKSSVAAEQDLGNAFLELQRILRGTAARQNPLYAHELQSANRAYAELIRLQKASAAAINQGGVFTPGQYNMAVRAADRSKHKAQSARGKALGQDLGAPAQRILGNTYPDSGTAGRLLQSPASAVSTAVMSPLLLASGALYTPAVQRALVGLATKPRPGYANALAEVIRQAGPVSTAAGLGMARDQ